MIQNIYTQLFFIALLSTNAQAQDEKLNVLSSANIFADMASNIGGDLIDSDFIVPTGGDPHLYEPTPSDVIKVKNANIILLNGLTFEGWINELIENSGTKAKVYTITKGVNAIKSSEYENSADPHAWMDVSNTMTYADNIYSALVENDAKNEAVYKSLLESYKKKLNECDTSIEAKIAQIPTEKRILITSHDAFSYYGRRYGLQLEALLGISTEAEITTSDIIRVNRIIEEKAIPTIFVESTINPKVLNQIAKDNDVVIGGELFADSLDDPENEAGTYIGMMTHNTDVIVKALTANQSDRNTINEDKNNSNLWLYLFIGTLLIGGLVLMIKKLS